MRTKLLTFILMAGTVVGCASNPPPPPPMAAAPMAAPAPAPMTVGPVDGKYKGMAELNDGSAPRCAKMTRAQYITVRNNSFVLGVKATIAPDGTVTATPRRGNNVTGTASGTGLDLTVMKGRCNYHYTMTKM